MYGTTCRRSEAFHLLGHAEISVLGEGEEEGGAERRGPERRTILPGSDDCVRCGYATAIAFSLLAYKILPHNTLQK